MPKIPDCDRCFYYSHNYHLVCALHPTGIEGDSCSDFTPNLELEGKKFMDFLGIGASQEPDTEQWEPEGASYYNGELILHQPRLTPEQQLDLLDWHPLFTSRCPNCEMPMQFATPPVHWDCSCGWKDDSL